MPVSDYLPSSKTLYRGYNALVAAAVLVQYTQNSTASAIEYLPDVAFHAFEALAPDSLNDIAIVANTVRAVQAGISFWSGKSTIPSTANAVDVFNHAVNLKQRFSNSGYSFIRSQLAIPDENSSNLNYSINH